MLRLLIRTVTLLCLALAVFAASRAIIRALPGDPLETLVAETGTSVAPETLRAELKLDRPYFTALREDLRDALQGDFGVSLISRQPIAPLLLARFLRTLQLTALAAVLTLVFSLSLGLLAADRSTRLGSIADQICTFYGALVTAMPTPWIGPLLMAVLCVWIPILPTGEHILLPALTLALSFTGFWARLVRERVRETLALGAAPGARARGIPEWKVLLKYGLAPCSGALLAYLGTQLGGLLSGAFVTEMIFDWNGMGSLLIEAVLKRDYPVVESAIFVAALASLIGNSFGDWAQEWMDPRLR